MALVPPDDATMPEMYRLSTDEETGFRWRFNGRVLGPEEFVQSLWQDVLSQHVAVSLRDGSPQAWVCAYAPNMRDGHVRIALAAWPHAHGTVVAWESIYLFIRYLFANWPFRKLYAEVREFNFVQFASGEGQLFEREGVLREHVFHRGRYWDAYMLSVTRRRFEGFEQRYERFFAPRPEAVDVD